MKRTVEYDIAVIGAGPALPVLVVSYAISI